MAQDHTFDEQFYWRPIPQLDRPEWIKELNDAFYNADVEVCKDWFLQIREHINKRLYGWVESAIYLYWVRRRKSYQLVYPTWRDFCEKWLHKKAYQVNQLIKCAVVIKKLIESGFNVLPSNQSQAYKLTKLSDKELIKTWEKVLVQVPTHLITAEAIEATIKGEPLATKKRIEVPLPNWEKFEQRCRDAGKNPKDELGKILEDYEPEDEPEDEPQELFEDQTEPVDPEKIDLWQTDLGRLIKEHDDQQSWFSKLTLWLFGGQIGAIALSPSPPE